MSFSLSKVVPKQTDAMLPAVQESNSLSSRNLSKYQRAKHRNGIRCGAIKMPGGFSCRVEPGHRPALAQDLRLFVGGETAECIGDGADQGIGEKRRLGDRARPVRFRRPQFARRRQSVAARRVESRSIAGGSGIECVDRLAQMAGGNSDQRRKPFDSE